MKPKLNKIHSLLLLGLLSIVLLGGCGEDTKDITVKEDANQQKETENPEETEKKEETESKLGSRSNPVPFQTTATVDDELYNDEGEAFPIKFDLTVVEVVRGDAAYQKLRSMNEFNEPAPKGFYLTYNRINYFVWNYYPNNSWCM